MIHELAHVLLDPAHWVAEVVMDGTLVLITAPITAWWVKRHDKKQHQG